MTICSGPVRDWLAATDLIRNSWKQNRQTPLDYTPEYLKTLVEYPGAGPAVAPAYYDHDDLVAFVAGFPRSVRLQGQTRTLLLMSFFTVAPNYQGKGYGRAIWMECLRQAKTLGYDGAFHYCVDGNSSNAITVAAAQEAGFACSRVFTVRYLMRLLRPGTGPESQPDAVDTALFQKASESLGAELPLMRLWSAAEAQWQMQSSGRWFSTDADGGLLSGCLLHVADTAHTPCFFFEDILWDRLAPEARGILLQRLLDRIGRTATLAVVPLLQYADPAPFAAAGFRRSPRVLHAYLTGWNAGANVQQFPGMYLDIV